MQKPLPKLDTRSLGTALATQRSRAKLSQEEVAERLNIGQEAVSRLERGVVVPSLQRLLELAAVYKCGIEEFISPASSLADDQVVWLSKRLAELRTEDRDLVVNMIDKICSRLSR